MRHPLMIFKWFANRRQFQEDHEEAVWTNALPPCHYCGKSLFTEGKYYLEYDWDGSRTYGCVKCWDVKTTWTQSDIDEALKLGYDTISEKLSDLMHTYESPQLQLSGWVCAPNNLSPEDVEAQVKHIKDALEKSGDDDMGDDWNLRRDL